VIESRLPGDGLYWRRPLMPRMDQGQRSDVQQP
jgi:hypothetical protein